MTIGSESIGTGVAKADERFAGQIGYRPRSNRENVALPSNPLDGPVTVGSSVANHGIDDFGPRGGRPGLDRLSGPLDIAAPIASTLTQPKLSEPTLAELREPSFPEPAFTPEAWLEAAGGPVAEHPLLRGLLLELPPKGATMHGQWLDRWFEAARSILELLYRFDGPIRD